MTENLQGVRLLRRRLLRLMVLGLAIAAVAGGAAILTSAGAMFWRVGGTAVVAAVAIAVSLSLIGLLEHPRRARGAMAGIGVIAASALLFVLAIWSGLLGFAKEERLWLTAIAVAMCGGVAAALLNALSVVWSRVAGAVGLVITGAVFACSLAVIWNLTGRSLEDRVVETALWLGGLAPGLCVPLVGTLSGGRHWRFVGVAAAGVALVMALQNVWLDLPQRSVWVTELCIIAGLAAHANVMDRIPVHGLGRWIALAAMSCAGVAAALLSYLNFETWGFSRPGSGELLERGILASTFVGACATLAVPVLYALEKRRSAAHAAEPMRGVTAVTLECPNCRARQDAPVGTSRCVKCGLMISIAVAEPKCEGCGYSLLNIQGDVCPECGVKAPAKGVALVPEEEKK